MNDIVNVGVILKRRDRERLYCSLTKVCAEPTIANRNKIKTKLHKDEIKFAINEATNKIEFENAELNLVQIQEVVKAVKNLGYKTITY